MKGRKKEEEGRKRSQVEEAQRAKMLEGIVGFWLEFNRLWGYF